jgi:ribosomal protein L40E
MFCPNCGAKNSVELKYCRACGLNLEQTTQSLRAQKPDGRSSDILRREQTLERFGNVAFAGLGGIFLIGMIALVYTILSKMVFSGQNPAFGVFLVLFIIFAALSLTYVVFREDLKERKGKLHSAPISDTELGSDTAKLLESGDRQPIASIVEGTTELLHTESKTRKL